MHPKAGAQINTVVLQNLITLTSPFLIIVEQIARINLALHILQFE